MKTARACRRSSHRCSLNLNKLLRFLIDIAFSKAFFNALLSQANVQKVTKSLAGILPTDVVSVRTPFRTGARKEGERP